MNALEPHTAVADAHVKELYEWTFPAVARFVSKRNGSFEDAKDVFHDALVIYYERAADPSFAVNTTEEAYVFGVVRHLWYRKFREEARLADVNDDVAEPVKDVEVDNIRLVRLLMATGRRCMNLLHAFYYSKLPVKQLSLRLGYGSERSATVQKYKCMEKVRDTIKKQSLGYEDFLN